MTDRIINTHPILFSAPMVRALLDGSKTQTRRVVKPQPEWVEPATIWQQGDGHSGTGWYAYNEDYPDEGALFYRCPYGQPGDRLWVRETWRIGAWCEDTGSLAIDYLASTPKKTPWITVPEDADNYHGGSVFEKYWIESTDDCIVTGVKPGDDDRYHWEPGQSPCRKRPSIHLPRWASRITLKITAVRVERLQDIIADDAQTEGIVPAGDGNGWQTSDTRHYMGDPVSSYRSLWESINGPDSWDLNPWVWVIEFKRVIA